MIIPNEPQTAASVADHYNDLDDYYRELWGEHVHHGYWETGKESPDEAVIKLIGEIAAGANIEEGDRVCDIGCGYGGTSRRLAEEYGATVTGLTISDAQHAYASEQTEGSNPTYLLQNWLENEFEDETFDAVVSIEVLSHIEEQQKYFDEIYRVLKPGGRASLAVWLATERPRRWEVKQLLEPICREGRLSSLGNVPEYNEMMEQAGLEIESYRNVSKLVRKTWRICAWRLAKGLMSNREYRKDLFGRRRKNWIFAITLMRIIAAFRTGSMQYGLYVLKKN